MQPIPSNHDPRVENLTPAQIEHEAQESKSRVRSRLLEIVNKQACRRNQGLALEYRESDSLVDELVSSR